MKALIAARASDRRKPPCEAGGRPHATAEQERRRDFMATRMLPAGFFGTGLLAAIVLCVLADYGRC